MKLNYSALDEKYKGYWLEETHYDADVIHLYQESIHSLDQISFECDGIIIDGDLFMKKDTLWLRDLRTITVKGNVEVMNLIAEDSHVGLESKVIVNGFIADLGNDGSLIINELIAKLGIFNDDHYTEINETDIDMALGYVDHKSVKRPFTHDEIKNFLEKNHPDLFDCFFGSFRTLSDLAERQLQQSDKLIAVLDAYKNT